MEDYTPLYDYSSISAEYERAHKNDNRNAQAMANNANVYNYHMWLNQVDAERKNWREQFDATNDYNTPAAQRARLEAAGINPAFSNLSTGEASMPTSGLHPAASAEKADTIPNDLTMGQAFESLNQSVSNYFQGRSMESAVRKTDAETALLNQSSAAKVAQEYNNVVLGLKQIDGLKIDNETKEVLRDTYKEELSRLRRLSGYYDQNIIWTANNAEQDYKESQERVAASQLSRDLNVKANSRAERQVNAYVHEVHAKVDLMKSQKKVSDEEVKQVVAATDKLVAEATGKHLDNGERAELYDMVIEEAKGEHTLWQYNNEVDKEVMPLDAFFGRVGRWIVAKKIGIKK